MKKIKYIIVISLMLLSMITVTYCAFSKSVSKDGTITTIETSAVFLNNNDFLTKIQVLDSSIATVDKTTDLNQVTTLPTVTFTSDNLVSTTTSSLPIYAWIDNGVIYYYTGASSVDLNNN